MSHDLLLIAASGLAREAISSWHAAGREVLGLLDDDPSKAGTSIAGLPVLGTINSAGRYPDAALLICAGKGTSRLAIAARLTALGITADRYATVVDPSVHLPASCTIGAGSILLAGTVLTADVTVGRHVVCMPGVILTHDDKIGDFATLAAGVTLGGGVHIGEAAYLGMNSTVRESLSVGSGAVLGMGSVLLTDQPPQAIWAGVPARELTLQKEPS